MPAEARTWTYEMLADLPDDGNRYEIVDGVLLVSPSPSLTHQRAVRDMLVRLSAYLDPGALGEVLPAPADVVFSPVRVAVPDLFVIPRRVGRLPRAWKDTRELRLIVEVLSPSTARHDRQTKRRMYQSEHVAEYWIVDLDARVVERWYPSDTRPEVLTDMLVWQPDLTHAAFELDLAAYFARVFGE